ncbi:hypothetical protein GGX14DRAFT_632842 [Mycena pura]|uniref:Uncharacterized protein n=1 Tax=Mycena pura TaxID=153505 RepID=A0AAD6YAS1_9AGAR|nr:hypothetical protein GGX14DRAFT_632842 [Mycena pura]
MAHHRGHNTAAFAEICPQTPAHGRPRGPRDGEATPTILAGTPHRLKDGQLCYPLWKALTPSIRTPRLHGTSPISHLILTPRFYDFPTLLYRLSNPPLDPTFRTTDPTFCHRADELVLRHRTPRIQLHDDHHAGSRQGSASLVGVFACPSEIPMDVFVEKCGEVMDAILATPLGGKLVRLEMMFPDATNNARLEQLGWTVDKKTVTTLSEFASVEDFLVYAADAEVKQIIHQAQEAFGNETRLLAADVVRKV